MVFTKVVNSVRRGYRNRAGGTGRSGLNGGGVGEYTPSEWTVMDDGSEVGGEGPVSKDKGKQRMYDDIHDTDSNDDISFAFAALTDESSPQSLIIHRLQSHLQALIHENRDLELNLTCLKVSYQDLSASVSPPRVAIKSRVFQDRYFQLNPESLAVRVGTSIAEWETFELERHGDNSVSFRSTCAPPAWLSADGSAISPGEKRATGGGWVGGSRNCGDKERFWIHKSDHGECGLEPVLYQGRFLRMDGNWHHSVNLQGVKSYWEEFYLMVC